jgi:hypothetical protein
MAGRLRKAFTGRMDVLASFVGYKRTGQRWWFDEAQPSRTIQPDASFWTIRADALVLRDKGLLRTDSSMMRFTITQEGIDEWNRLWPEHPARIASENVR